MRRELAPPDKPLRTDRVAHEDPTLSKARRVKDNPRVAKGLWARQA